MFHILPIQYTKIYTRRECKIVEYKKGRPQWSPLKTKNGQHSTHSEHKPSVMTKRSWLILSVSRAWVSIFSKTPPLSTRPHVRQITTSCFWFSIFHLLLAFSGRMIIQWDNDSATIRITFCAMIFFSQSFLWSDERNTEPVRNSPLSQPFHRPSS